MGSMENVHLSKVLREMKMDSSEQTERKNNRCYKKGTAENFEVHKQKDVF